jgi:hypothetical protein
MRSTRDDHRQLQSASVGELDASHGVTGGETLAAIDRR